MHLASRGAEGLGGRGLSVIVIALPLRGEFLRAHNRKAGPRRLAVNEAVVQVLECAGLPWLDHLEDRAVASVDSGARGCTVGGFVLDVPVGGDLTLVLDGDVERCH